jgi:hypothetical protein
MTSDLPPILIDAGMSIDAAFVAFRAGCNFPPHRLWILPGAEQAVAPCRTRSPVRGAGRGES